MATDELLQRSLQLLEESLHGKGKGLLRYTSPSRYDRGQQSLTIKPRLSVGESLFSPSQDRNRFKLRQSDVENLSITLNPGELANLLDSPTSALTRTKIKQASDNLFTEFMDSLQSHGSQHQVFAVIADFAQSCTDMLECLRDQYADNAAIEWLENERNSWRLVYCLYQSRLREQSNGHRDLDMDTSEDKQVSEKEVVSQHYKTDTLTRECQLVVDWLEKNAADHFQNAVAPRVSHYVDKTVAWENTLHQLQNEPVMFSSSRATVTELDPDAPLRQRKPLHDLDMEDECRLLEEVFACVRCGQLEKAQRVCMHCGQAWRAGSLEGWRLHHDPNFTIPSTTEKLPIEGNPNRDLWKLCAWQLCEESRAPPQARAIYGALCGHIQSLLQVCRGWEDLLWAHARCLVDRRVELAIRGEAVRHYAAMPDAYWNYKLSLEDIFSELAADSSADVRLEASKPTRLVQQMVVLGKVPQLIDKMADWVQHDSCTHHLIRFLAHLVLVFRLLGQSEIQDSGDQVIKAYVKVLTVQDDPQLVAYYVATLASEDQADLYAGYLEAIDDPEMRRQCLDAAQAVDLPVESITQIVVETIRNKDLARMSSDLSSETSSEDARKVSALDWVVFYPQQRCEAMWQTNALIRTFVAQGKLEAARDAFNKIPGDSINLVVNQFQSALDEAGNMDVDTLPIKVAVTIREYFCHKAYLDAQEAFSEWFQHYHNAKPQELTRPNQANATFTEKVAFDHRMARYNQELERWKVDCSHLTKSVKAQLYNVLLFVDGGWLVDSEPSGDSLRDQQMSSLRSFCLPKVVLLLHTVLHSMGAYEECVRLADVIVSEQTQLYKVHTKQQIRELLYKIAQSSVALLEMERDPWGHAISS